MGFTWARPTTWFLEEAERELYSPKLAHSPVPIFLVAAGFDPTVVACGPSGGRLAFKITW